MVNVAGVEWNRGEEGWMKTRDHGLRWSLVGVVGVDEMISCVVGGGGMKYLTVLASASSSLVPVSDCMYFLSGSLISAICGWSEAETRARMRRGE